MPALAHIGIGLATKRFAPQIPLWALLLSAMFIDILSFLFLFAIWISHGLFMSVIWSIIAMLITALIKMRLNSKKEQDKKTKSPSWSIENLHITLIIGLLVFSHWVLDFIGWPMSVIDPSATGVPLLFDDAVNIGLGVYSTWFGALLMDIGVFVVGLGIYIHYVKKVKKIN
ncbi:MAG: hypothetical protein HWN81_18075 [Candidatus Lokiarchaeota archaeon]|nr:hypothetical protein [Candidatus Lokiarchaeota archaeon]